MNSKMVTVMMTMAMNTMTIMKIIHVLNMLNGSTPDILS